MKTQNNKYETSDKSQTKTQTKRDKILKKTRHKTTEEQSSISLYDQNNLS